MKGFNALCLGYYLVVILFCIMFFMGDASTDPTFTLAFIVFVLVTGYQAFTAGRVWFSKQ